MEKENQLIVFQGKNIRRIWYNKEWYFSVVDVIEVLTDSPNPNNYWKVLKHRLKEEGSELVTNCNQLKLKSTDGKFYLTDCANLKQVFRLIQSIPSKKAEPFKMWLAQIGKERIDEIQNPELAGERMKAIYEQKGYSKDWIDKRLRGIAIRQNLTEEWKERGIETEQEYAILTAEISQATFGMTPKKYKKLKNLDKENLRDHMNDLELIFTMLGEKVTTEISKNEKPETFVKSKVVAKRGGKVAGNARKEAEKEIGKSVISKENYLEIPESKKRLK